MRDVVMVVTVVAFFALAAAYVRWCDGLLGPDPLTDPDQGGDRAPGALIDEVGR